MPKRATGVDFSTAFIENVKRLRKTRGWTVERLVEELRKIGCSISKNTISNQEGRQQGSVAVQLDHAVWVARAFGVSIEDLLSSPCSVCHGAPPPGFICKNCGKTTEEAV